MNTSVVWFKRDLRLHDHQPLSLACAQGPVLCLYIIEPSLWQQPDSATQHYQFIVESLAPLQREVERLDGVLTIEVGEATEVLARLHQRLAFTRLYSHQETGNAHTFARDRAVASWCHHQQVQWAELPQFGVVRALRDRNQWQAAWEAFVAQPITPAPQHITPPAAWGVRASTPQAVPTATALGLMQADKPHRQRGGRPMGEAVLRSFLHQRAQHYRGGISSPLTAPNACSRLSPYLAYGCLSLREVVQATRSTMLSPNVGGTRLKQGLNAFMSRLYWHCHFIQKLESQPDIEWRNLHRGYDHLREPDWNPEHFEALKAGRTGWPMVDAAVAMLRDTGWINFRMRAMLVSVAAYPLWLHWQPVGQWLAQEFLDYEPGIHWSQHQMQAGTTGINTTRVYNPIKQAQDHDPQGLWVRQWLPYMRQVPDSWLFEPWLHPQAASLGVPMPQVDLATATRLAKQRVHQLRAQPDVKAAKAAIVQRHGSRKVSSTRKSTRSNAPSTQQQLDLGFEP